MSTTLHPGGGTTAAEEVRVTIRICGPADESALEGLARLDSARPLEGTILAAEVDDTPLAAICLETGRVVADPFAHTAALVSLLRARAAQLRAAQEERLPQRSHGLRRLLATLPGHARGINP